MIFVDRRRFLALQPPLIFAKVPNGPLSLRGENVDAETWRYRNLSTANPEALDFIIENEEGPVHELPLNEDWEADSEGIGFLVYDRADLREIIALAKSALKQIREPSPSP